MIVGVLFLIFIMAIVFFVTAFIVDGFFRYIFLPIINMSPPDFWWIFLFTTIIWITWSTIWIVKERAKYIKSSLKNDTDNKNNIISNN